MGSMSKL